MAKGYIKTGTLDNGCYFQLQWEQIKYPNNLYSILKFELYFYTPEANITIWNPWGELAFRDSRESSPNSSTYGGLSAPFNYQYDPNYNNEDMEFTFTSPGLHKMPIYTFYAKHYSANISDAYMGNIANAYHIPHYSSGAPKSSYILYDFLSSIYVRLDLNKMPKQLKFEEATIVLDSLTSSGGGESGGTTQTIKPSVINALDAYIGDETKITLTTYGKAYHTITYKFGNLTGTVVTKNNNLILFWPVPTEFINELATGSSHDTCELTCETYDLNGNYYGKTTTTFIARLDVNKEGPTFNPTIYDNNSKTVALTGDKNNFIRYYSEAYVTPGSSGKSGATIVNETVSCGSYKGSYNGTGVVYLIENVDSGNFVITATDSRGATASTTVNRILIPYEKISCNIFDLTLNVNGTLTFKIEGNYFNENFGATNNSLTLKYKINEGSYVSVKNADIEFTGHNYAAYVTVTGLDYSQVYNVEAVATDKLSSAGKGNVYNITGKSLFDWGKEDFNFNVLVKAQEGVQVAADQAIYGDDEGSLHEALIPLDSTGNTVLGRGGYTRNNGDTIIYGTNVDIMAHEDITINGKSLLEQNVLWQGGYMMTAGHTINLGEGNRISQQKNGIVLVFSLYRNGAAEDVSINSFFISKKEVELLDGAPHFFFLGINAGFSSLAGKYIYIHDDKLVGHEGNDDVGSSVISFSNSSYVLRYVIGV